MQTTTKHERPSLTEFCLLAGLDELGGDAGCDDAEPWEQVEADLQMSLFGPREQYRFPAAELLKLDRPQRRRRGPETLHSHKTDADVIHALHGVHRHRGRGLSRNDWEVQREFESRCCGVGWVFKLHRLDLPYLYAETLGAGRARRLIVRMMMLADAQGWLGVYGPAPKLAEALRIDRATWWRAVAWLEARGWICRVRSYKTRRHGQGEAPVDLSRNAYVPGPTLLLWRSIYRSELGPGDRSVFLAAVEREARFRRGQANYTGAQTAAEAAVTYVEWVRHELYQCEAQERARDLMDGRGWSPAEPKATEVPEQWWPDLEALVTDPLAVRSWDSARIAGLLTPSHDATGHLRGENQERKGVSRGFAGRPLLEHDHRRVRPDLDSPSWTLGQEGMSRDKTRRRPPD